MYEYLPEIKIRGFDREKSVYNKEEGVHHFCTLTFELSGVPNLDWIREYRKEHINKFNRGCDLTITFDYNIMTISFIEVTLEQLQGYIDSLNNIMAIVNNSFKQEVYEATSEQQKFDSALDNLKF